MNRLDEDLGRLDEALARVATSLALYALAAAAAIATVIRGLKGDR